MKNSPRFFPRTFLTCLLLIFVFTQSIYAQEQEPDYAKWGEAAIAEVKKQYPESQETDYEYLGRKRVSQTESQDTFEFRVTTGGQKKLVRAYVSFHPQTNKLVRVRLTEVQP
ncbi:DUF3889 domain-containing protein [Ammoniphilus resinae]|uniref:DUF3889 domain-containing protein n=1 Tax=Ammoniphilus resinae TaxID=861532 RepID=A0ABS4GVM5_9BACL|nr:DUF3889 domain-containing protein [Ammoniphilus resinae]MBP1934325.1 hypothetical protein [Ammoniphilus resinae]